MHNSGLLCCIEDHHQAGGHADFTNFTDFHRGCLFESRAARIHKEDVDDET